MTVSITDGNNQCNKKLTLLVVAINSGNVVKTVDIKLSVKVIKKCGTNIDNVPAQSVD